MKNSLGRMIYHSFVCWYHTMTKLRGGVDVNTHVSE